MLVSTTFPLHIYFGTACHAVNRNEIMHCQNQLGNGYDTLNSICKLLSIDHLVLLDYIVFAPKYHGRAGKNIMSPPDIPTVIYDAKGDYLITAQTNIGLALLAADCLPIILYDSEHHACAIVHAGRKASIEHIVVKALEKMMVTYGTQAVYVQAFFGPCAKVCCYRVQDDVVKEMANSPFGEQILQKKRIIVFLIFLY